MRNRLLAILLVALSGCGSQAVSSYRVTSDQGRFSQTVDGRTVSFANWQLTVGGKSIAIPAAESTIILRHRGGHVAVEVNGKTVFED